MIGLHNGFLMQALSQQGMGRPEFWRELHETTCESAEGYVFHTNQRNCWAAPFKPGWTNDVTWATYEEWQGQEPQEAVS